MKSLVVLIILLFSAIIDAQNAFIIDKFGSVTSEIHNDNDDDEQQVLVLWHGMGDSYNSSSMAKVIEVFQSSHPDLFIYSIRIDEDNDKDQQLSIFGNVSLQVDQVCQDLQKNLPNAKIIDGIGFSQGGLFLRALLETCNNFKLNNLITFGSPHNGIYDLPMCKNQDWFCKNRNSLLKKQAQYFRDIYSYDEYLKESVFLKYINNDDGKNWQYKDNLIENLQNKLVMVMFNQDQTLVPKQSAWFYDFDVSLNKLLLFNETTSFNKNLIGLKTLYQKDKVEFLTIDAQHMEIDQNFLKFISNKYIGQTKII
ncbi:hypothetical protein PACTADRAFT_50352 [Pachysolen tannophilus NRRL Y-2460]|uniref:Palmitoyl-protein thioesterase 1 n=1 Tax=Pachysolen tannophilus NRRL Y-2460 TaxID=669874 RepID=A0A1E4TV61_PACTA|nr:hypothetical protein PACTADRAFT_50352 [Pachysolen tannophilus NRRL Y-2460]